MKFFYLLISLFFLSNAYSQNVPAEKTVTIKDSSASKKSKPDTTAKQKVYSPKVAARRSAIIPGWGQAYNKKYWKIPIIYGGLGVTGYIFVNNIKIYKEYKFAYSARIKAEPPDRDSTDYDQLDPIYKVLSPNSIRSARDEFRRYVDYSALIFIILWGLNVVDAAVDAHLKNFDISPDLSLQLRPGYSELAQTSGVSLVLKIGK
ncbi:MAG TPA: DUF5683 domain-containing protein [Chitinophagaceae bacterium]|nr:DUF5683 domain-containing protein [Chitinophagaceae bacterium]